MRAHSIRTYVAIFALAYTLKECEREEREIVCVCEK